MLIVPFIGYGQVEIDKKRLHLFLDYVANSMKGDPVNKSLYAGQKAIYASDYEFLNIDGSSEISYQGEVESAYKYMLHNKRVGKYLGIDFDSFEGAFIWSTVFAKNSEKYELNNIIEIYTIIMFMRRNMNSTIADDIESRLISEINSFFQTKCTVGLRNKQVNYAKESKMGGFIDKNQTFEINCSGSCSNCFIEFQIGFQTSGVGINDGYSHILHLSFRNKTNYIDAVVNNNIMDGVNFKVVNPKNSSNKIDLRDINLYDLTAMINFFLLESNKFGCKIGSIGNINASFETLKDNTIALSYGINNNDIILKVDPEKWAKSSTEKKWYVLYHELGHDVLNLNHGQGGKMMFNFADRNYSWKEFNDDKKYMFKYFNEN